MKCYAFLGIQGSGKGTQAEKLSSALGFKHINIGDLLRNNIKLKTPIGIEANKIIQKGELVSDEMVFALIQNTIDERQKGIVFDGFPRTIAQAEYLLKHYNLINVFYLDLEEQSAIERISARRICSHCRENYNINTQPPKVTDICDKCGNKLVMRQDDKPDAMHKRFEHFYEQTLPLKKLFESHNLLTLLDANQSVDDIFKQILVVTNRISNE
jgi:adenylate kinase